MSEFSRNLLAVLIPMLTDCVEKNESWLRDLNRTGQAGEKLTIELPLPFLPFLSVREEELQPLVVEDKK